MTEFAGSPPGISPKSAGPVSTDSVSAVTVEQSSHDRGERTTIIVFTHYACTHTRTHTRVVRVLTHACVSASHAWGNSAHGSGHGSGKEHGVFPWLTV